jgi:hypothetical protein
VAKNLALVVVTLALAGCATAAPVAMGNDTYMISQTSAGGVFTNMGSLKSEVIQRANAFAESKGKVAIPLASKESPAIPGRSMPNFEYQFRLVDKNDPRATGAALVPRPDVVIEQHDTVRTDVQVHGDSSQKDLYTELMKLDDLRRKGIITDAEFDVQKKKLLEAAK